MASALGYENCGNTTFIKFSTTDGASVLAINRKAVFANKCAGGSRSLLKVFCAMLDAPSPVSKNIYTQYNKEVGEKSLLQAQASVMKAREEVRDKYGATFNDIVDILVSCDGTCQKRGFTSIWCSLPQCSYVIHLSYFIFRVLWRPDSQQDKEVKHTFMSLYERETQDDSHLVLINVI